LVQQISTEGVKIIEISVGLGAAAIIIDKVLSWTLKWKRSDNGTGKKQLEEATRAAFERPQFVLHDAKMNALCEAVTNLCKSDVAKSQTLSDILSSSKRQEEILGGIREDFRNGGQR
jgi:hypothetical protein